MYCSNCGKTLNSHLNYCNNCGTRVENKPLIVSNASSPILSMGSVFIGITGLVGFFFVMREMLRSPLETGAVVVIMIAYLLTVLVMFAVLIGHVWKNSGEIRVRTNSPSDDFREQNSFKTVNTAQLAEHREPAMSVTDHTTRTLDEMPLKRG